jgi:hypothetical protein
MIESEVLLSRELKMSRDGGVTFTQISIQIGFPKYTEDGDAICVLQMIGIADGVRTIYGVDNFQAVEMAIKFVNTFLGNPAPSSQFYWPDGQLFKQKLP